MLRWRLVISALGLWLLAGAGFAAPGAAVLRAIRMKQYRLANIAIRDELDAIPDDADLHALHGLVLSHLGQYVDAASAFQFGLGSRYYERDGLEAHAETLRALGEGARAAELRRQRRLYEGTSDGRDLGLLLGMVDDYRSVGDLAAAEEAAWQALAVYPRSSAAHAFKADLALDRGEFADAEFHLWLAGLSGPPMVRSMLVEARLELALGNLQGATRCIDSALDKNPRNIQVRAWRVELLRQEGRLDEALALLSMKRYALQEYPQMLALEAMTCWDLGQRAEALELLARAEALYSAHADVRVARAWVEREP